MKLVFSSLIITLGLVLTPLAVYSQEQDGCFMRDPNGKLINLTNLCETGEGGIPNSQNVNNTGLFTIPIKRREAGIPVIDVLFNGKHSFEMLLDTGASATVLTVQMAKTVGVKTERMVMVSTPGGVVQAPLGRVQTAQVGGARENNVVVAISEHMHIGLLGQNFFGHYDVTIKQNVIELRVRK